MPTETLGLVIEIDDRDQPKITKFTRSIDDLNQNLDKSKDKFGQVEEKTKKFTDVIDKSGHSLFSLKNAIMGVAASYGLLKLEQLIGQWIRLFGAQDQAERGLKQVMISMDRYSGSFFQSMLNQASAMQRVTGINDELIISGQKFLMTFKQIPDSLMPRVTNTMLDLAALMGGNVQQAALQLGKAAMGMTGELRRVGITVDEETFKLKGFEGVLEEIEMQVKGQAAALGEGYGKWKILGASIGDTKEKLGSIFHTILDNAGVIDGLTASVYGLNIALEKLSKVDEKRLGLTAQQRAFDPIAINQTVQRANQLLQSIIAESKLTPEDIEGFIIIQKKLEEIAKSLTPEFQKARVEVLNMLDALKTTEISKFQKEVDALNEKFKPWRDQLGEMPELLEAYNLSLAALREKYKTTIDSQAEYNEVLKKLNELAYQLDLTPFQKEVDALDKEFKDFFDTLGKTPEVMAIYDKALDKIREKLGIPIIPDKVTKGLSDFFEKDMQIRMPGEGEKFGKFDLELEIKPIDIAPVEIEFEKIATKWDEMVTDMADVGKNALSDFLMDFEFDFEDFAKGIRRVWADLAAEFIIKDISISGAKKGLGFVKDFFTQKKDTAEIANAVSDGVAAGIKKTDTSSSTGGLIGLISTAVTFMFDKYIANEYGSSERDLYGNLLFPAYYGTVKWAGDQEILPSWFRPAEWFQGPSPEPEPWIAPDISFDLVFESINDQISLASEEWINTDPKGKLVLAIQDLMNSQIEFYEELANYTKLAIEVPVLSGRYIESTNEPRSDSDLLTMFTEGMQGKFAYETLLKNKPQILSMGGPWAELEYDELLNRLTTIISSTTSEIKEPWKEVYMNLNTTVDDWELLFRELEKVVLTEEQRQALSAKWSIETTSTKTEGTLPTDVYAYIAKWWSRHDKTEDIAELYAELKLMLNPELAYADILPEILAFQEKFNAHIATAAGIISETLADALNNAFYSTEGGLSDALNEGMVTADYSIFKKNITKNLADSFMSVFMQEIISKELAPKLFAPFLAGTNDIGIASLLTGYAEGDYTISYVVSEISAMFGGLSSVFTEMQPIFESISTGIGTLKDAIDYNSLATQENTSAILEQLENYLQELTTGNLTPAVSAELMENTFNKLLTEAMVDQDKIDEFAAFGMGNYLDFFKEYGGNYQDYWQKVVNAINSFINTITGGTAETGGLVTGPPMIPMGDYTDYDNPYRSKSINLNLYIDGEPLSKAAFRYVEKNDDAKRSIRRITASIR